MNRIKAWYIFSYRVWFSLGLGWGALLLGLTPYVCLDQTGALLVCAAIVAEVFHDKRHRLFVNQVQPGVTTGYIYKEVDVPGENRKDIEITAHQMQSGPTTVNTEPWTLYHLANKEDFYADGSTRRWHLERTMKRVESKVDYAIVITAIIGTALWAFG